MSHLLDLTVVDRVAQLEQAEHTLLHTQNAYSRLTVQIDHLRADLDDTAEKLGNAQTKLAMLRNLAEQVIRAQTELEQQMATSVLCAALVREPEVLCRIPLCENAATEPGLRCMSCRLEADGDE